MWYAAGTGSAHYELPALLTSSDGSVHTLTGSLEDLLYEAPPAMHKSIKCIPSTESQVSGCDQASGNRPHHPSLGSCRQSLVPQQALVDPPTGETNLQPDPPRAFPVVEKVTSDSSGSGSPEKEEVHDPVCVTVYSPHCRSELQDHPNVQGPHTGERLSSYSAFTADKGK